MNELEIVRMAIKIKMLYVIGLDKRDIKSHFEEVCQQITAMGRGYTNHAL